MDDVVGGEDALYDDGWDEVLGDSAQQLEDTAVRLTQARVELKVSATNQHNGIGIPDEAGIDQLRADQIGASLDGLPSSNYGDVDDDDAMLDGEIFQVEDGLPEAEFNHRQKELPAPLADGVTQRELWRQERYAQPYIPFKQPLKESKELDGLGSARAQCQIQPPLIPETEPLTKDMAALHDQLETLRRERECLATAMKIAEEKVFAKTGEIAIVRANASRLEREYESKMTALLQSHSTEVTKQKRDIEQARAELQKLATEKTFLENDLVEESKRAQILQKALKNKDNFSDRSLAAKALPIKGVRPPRQELGDGFDQDELFPPSPSEAGHQNHLTTPKSSSKRKRKPVDDSPVQTPLVLLPPPQAARTSVSAEQPPTVDWEASQTDEQQFLFLRSLLNHKMRDKGQKSIDILATFCLPSNPQQTLASTLLDSISPSQLSGSSSIYLPSAFAQEVILIWSSCIKEGYNEPIDILIDLVSEILTTSPNKTAPDLTDVLIALLQETADIIIIPRCQKKSPRPDRSNITAIACLELLELMTSQLAHIPIEANRLWRLVRFDFVMMLISFIHPLTELRLVIRVLHASILSKSFAMIIPPGDGKQDVSEARVIDNLTRLLVESPRPNQGEAALTNVELAQLRQAVLDLLDDMCSCNHAAQAMYSHRLLIGRLVRLANDSLVQIYRHTAARDKLVILVNASMRLIYYFLNNFGDKFRMQQKLSVIPGGEKKFLIVLTRLAFCEESYLDAGIEEEVSDLAHRMLEARVSPEEAEALMGVMSTARGSSATVEDDLEGLQS